MNKSSTSITIALFSCYLAGTLALAAAPRDFENVAPIQGELEQGEFYRIRIPGEVYAHCHDFPDDIRIFDVDGRQLPFFLWRSSDFDRTDEIETNLLNRSRAEGDIGYWRQDLRVEPRSDGVRPRHNRLIVQSTGREFIRRVEVFGSEQGEDWSLLADGFLVRMRRPTAIDNHTINYPESDFPRIQLRVYPSAMEALETFEIQRIELARSTRADIVYDWVSVTEIEPLPRDLNEDAQVIVLDAGYRRVPIEKLIFDVEQTEYARAVRVHGRNSQGDDWRHLVSAEIHSLSGSPSNEVSFRGSRNRYLKVEVYHYDDQPLSLRGIRAAGSARNLVFEACSTNAPALYYGSGFARPPRYDLRRRLADVDIAGLAPIVLGESTANSAYRPHGFGRWGPWLAGILVAIASLAVVAVIVDMIKRQRATSQ